MSVTEYPEMVSGEGRTVAVVGMYATRTDAYERSLVVAAMTPQTPNWVLKKEGEFALCVLPERATEVVEELGRFEEERREREVMARKEAMAGMAGRVPFSTISLWVCGWVLAGFYAMELAGPSWWVERGTASSRNIMHGQWWRVFTALTLHADLGHLGANLAVGLVCAGLLLPILGAGWTWMFLVLAGGVGNWLNAWGYANVEHLSIGASTAVFSAVGMLMGGQFMTRVMEIRMVRAREILVPVGAGLGLLGYLGVGDAQTDYMAHFFGLLAGVPFGLVGVWLRLGTRTPRWGQVALAWGAVGILLGCWGLAGFKGGR